MVDDGSDLNFLLTGVTVLKELSSNMMLLVYISFALIRNLIIQLLSAYFL